MTHMHIIIHHHYRDQLPLKYDFYLAEILRRVSVFDRFLIR